MKYYTPALGQKTNLSPFLIKGPNMNGLADRSTANKNAIIVLSVTPRFEAPNGSYIDAPEDFQRRTLP